MDKKNKSKNKPFLPWRNKKFLENYLKTKFKNRKPSLQEVSKSLGLTVSTTGRLINEFNLRKYITYYGSHGEISLRNFISQFIEVYQEEYYISDKKKNFYGIDIYIPNKKIGFEYNGTYWHSELFKSSIYHQKKSLVAAENGIQLFHIWEYEWMNPTKRLILESFIKSKLGIYKYKIKASKCQIVTLSYKRYADFCNKNHIQGEGKAKIRLGLVYQGKLIQIMSFDIPRFANSIEWEIVRECSKNDCLILGGKEKLWNYFIKYYHPKSVIIYCDYTKFNGISYLKLGFKKVRLNKPSFIWYNEKNRHIYFRNPCKNKDFKNKYIRIFDAGQLVFIWTFSK